MSELTLTLLRLGLLALLWIFIFSVVGVLRTDLYGTSVSRRSQRKAVREQERQERRAVKEARRAPTPAAVPAPARGRFGRGHSKRMPQVLVVTEGPLTGTSLPLRGQAILIGRNPECALVLDDDYASGRHCRIYPDSSGREGWLVEDLGSTNGTFIGREKLTSPQPVEVGTTLRIGKTVLEFRD
ncbi:MAG TPA: FHA domain-containing protein [Intrasporangium sp.]|jgi:FOG: FHA domain|uniref:FHA domain-containing protein FhaB/FipA n=1 Tax=Intrasporangium sp. TaxID=1925024 RepID=UPI002F9252AD